jgi:hypothetical protein
MTNSREGRKAAMKKNRTNAPEGKDGNISLDGFLGSDRRPLAEIIRADNESVKKLGLAHRAIADRMQFLREKGKDSLGEFVAVGPHFEVSCEIARGLLSCPFGEAGRIRKTMVTVRNLRLRKEIIFSDLNIHLIGAHGFYEGRGSPFRLEPVELAKILEIEE